MKLDRLPPHSEEAERGVLACILLDPESCLPQCESALYFGLDAFYDLRNRTIYDSCLRLFKRHQPTDLVTLHCILRDEFKWTTQEQLVYLQTLPEASPSAQNLSSYLDLLLEKFRARRIIQACTEVVSSIYENGHSTPSQLQNQFLRLQNLFVPQTLDSLTTLDPNSILNLNLPEHHQILGDHVLDLGSLTVLFGSGGTHKSRFVLQLAAAVSAQHPKFLAWTLHPTPTPIKWLFFQSENSTRRLKQDLLHIKNWIGPDAFDHFSKQTLILTQESELDAQLDLDQPQNFRRLQNALEDFNPHIVVFDALYNFSLRELRFGSEMLAAVSNCSKLAKFKNQSRTPLVLHHALPGSAGLAKATGLDRANFARDSKIIHQLARSAIHLTPLSQDSSDQLLVSCGKCSDSKEFLPFVVNLNPDSLILTCDPSIDALQSAKNLLSTNKRQSSMPPSRVRQLTTPSGSSRANLALAIQSDCGCTHSSAYKFIRIAFAAGSIILASEDLIVQN